ncbi:MAG: lytic transglycosylase domain-containing protein [Limnochordia bacterium]|nr:lytic transglycosylase domain-containing protein [Limnochordia bacterium]
MKGGSRLWRWFVIFLILLLVIGQLRWLLQRIYPISYGDKIAFYAEKHGLDPFLVYAVMYIESRINPEAISPRGARGLMQIMPDTAQWIASEIGLTGFDEDMLSIPSINILMGTWYLASLYREFGSSDVVVLAAYNAGRGNVARWLTDNTWSGRVTDVDQIPFGETREFVRRVMRVRDWYNYVYRGKWPFSAVGGN